MQHHTQVTKDWPRHRVSSHREGHPARTTAQPTLGKAEDSLPLAQGSSSRPPPHQSTSRGSDHGWNLFFFFLVTEHRDKHRRDEVPSHIPGLFLRAALCHQLFARSKKTGLQGTRRLRGLGWAGLGGRGQGFQRPRRRAHQERHCLEMVPSLSIYHLQFI